MVASVAASSPTQAEAMALLAAIQAHPPDVSLEIYSDSLSSIEALRTPFSGIDRKILRSPLRPMLLGIHQALMRRARRFTPSTVDFRFVRAHTMGSDPFSCGNRAIDALVSDALASPSPELNFSPHATDVIFQLWTGPRTPSYAHESDFSHIVGDPMVSVLEYVRAHSDGVLRSSDSGRFFGSDGFAFMGRRVLKSMRFALGFLVGLFTESVPNNLSRFRAIPKLYIATCPHCSVYPDDLQHLLRCSRSPPPPTNLVRQLISLPPGSITVAERFGLIAPNRIPHLLSLGLRVSRHDLLDLCLRTLHYAYDSWKARASLYYR
jgi:hypothetical protein